MGSQNEMDPGVAAWLGDEQGDTGGEWVLDALDVIYSEGPSLEAIQQAQASVIRALEDAGANIIYYDVMPNTPLGPIYVAVDKGGLLAVDIGSDEHRFSALLEKRYRAVVIQSSDKTREVRHQLMDYFTGQRDVFKLKLSLDRLTDFQRRVLEATMEVPIGQVSTYGEIARRIGRSRAARAVGQALARNPIPIVIPCHRVLGADGALHGYGAGSGLETKTWLLELEGAAVT